MTQPVSQVADARSLGLLWALLPARLVLFALAQGLVALGAMAFVDDTWEASLRWWPFGVVIVNILTIAVLARLCRAEGLRYRDFVAFNREHIRSDLPLALIVAAGLLVIAVVPNFVLAAWLFGSSVAAAELFVRGMPLWASLLLLELFPATIALAELPLYFAWIMPRLEAAGMRAWQAVLLPSFFAAAQHISMPLLFDVRFIAWRLLMFIPFAFALGIVLRSRPRLLPYLMVLHALLDISVVALKF